MKCSLGISNFLEEISSLSHSIVSLYFFALIAEKVFLTSSCYSLELCIPMGISFLFSFSFTSLLLIAICKASSDNHFSFMHFFSLGMVLIPASCTVSQTSTQSSSGSLSINSNLLNLFWRMQASYFVKCPSFFPWISSWLALCYAFWWEYYRGKVVCCSSASHQEAHEMSV